MRTMLFMIDTDPIEDPEVKGRESWTAVWIDPLSRSLKISQEFDPPSGKVLIWHGFDILRRLQNRPPEKIVRDYLNGERAQALLDRICNGHKKWNYGTDSIPDMNNDALSALDDLMNDLEHLPECTK